MSKICVIIPCYNESERLKEKSFLDFITENKNDFYFLFVNDGSSDSTLAKLELLSENFSSNINHLNMENNVGKAEAVRAGVNYAFKERKYDYISYFDADLATPLSELKRFKDVLDNHSFIQMVLGSRIKRLGSKVVRSKKRHILGRVFSTFASMILRLPVYDTQCGAKMIRVEIIPQIFQEKFIASWLFDVELIARLRNAFPLEIEQKLYELPLSEWKDVAGSKIKLKHMIKVPFELLRIDRKYNR